VKRAQTGIYGCGFLINLLHLTPLGHPVLCLKRLLGQSTGRALNDPKFIKRGRFLKRHQSFEDRRSLQFAVNVCE
jgi:hypothetical protein